MSTHELATLTSAIHAFAARPSERPVARSNIAQLNPLRRFISTPKDVRSSSVTFVEDVRYRTSKELRRALNSQYAQLPAPDPYVYDNSDAEDDDQEPDAQSRYPTPCSMPELPSVSQLPQPGGDNDSDVLERADGMSTQLVNQRYEDEFHDETDYDESQDSEGDSLEVGGNTLLDDQSMASTVNYPSLLPQPGLPSPLGN